jgi:hypothetical protein
MYRLRSCKCSIQNTLLFILRKKRQIEQILEEKSETIHAPRSGFLLFFAEVRIQGISY